MKTLPKVKLINDPIYGFVTVPSKLIFELIEHPYFQRLRRIAQMGMTYLVYPGAIHTRFHHALGAMFLMQKAVQVLRTKDVVISQKEEEALYVAILLHDIGHGPYSHAMEHTIISNVSHEQISLEFMKYLNREFSGKLDLGIKVFKNEYPRQFFHQLVSGQIDMDRLDYLKRDSFYTGVSEGDINSQRLIAMLNVRDDALVVEEKGIYSVENFLIARRLMYWQVYLHKTGVVAEQLLVRLLKRARELVQRGENLFAGESLMYFLKNSVRIEDFNDTILEKFAHLDDSDILCAMKQWSVHSDFVLRHISKMLLNRDLLKIEIKELPIDENYLQLKKNKMIKRLAITDEEASYFIFSGRMENQAYNLKKNPIGLLQKNGKVVDAARLSEQLNSTALSTSVVKYYLCFPKKMGALTHY